MTHPAYELARGAIAAMECPYFRHGGTCVIGCSIEPACSVDEPGVGWQFQLDEALVELHEASEPAPVLIPTRVGYLVADWQSARSAADYDGFPVFARPGDRIVYRPYPPYPPFALPLLQFEVVIKWPETTAGDWIDVRGFVRRILYGY